MSIRELALSVAVAPPGGEAAAEAFPMDEESFRAFYESTARPLWAYLARASRDSACADDLLQESYFHLLRARNLPPDETGRRRYLFRIATNLLRDRWRRGKREVVSALDMEREPAVERNMDAASDLRSAFDQLKPRERQVLWLAYVEDCDHREIATVTGLRYGSIRMLLFRARHKLAGILRGTPAGQKEG